ncbi:MAG: DUF992 domain-containing protein [Pseudomonadota bacterium]
MTLSKHRLALTATIAAAMLSPVAATAASIEIGQLTCRQTDRTNLIIFSEASFSCVFDPVEGGNETYRGSVAKIGVDLSSSKVETMVWYVFAPSAPVEGALAGDYFGASADAAAGAGIGARVLVGGFEDSISLQPAAISGQEGIGVAAGIEQFTLSQ